MNTIYLLLITVLAFNVTELSAQDEPATTFIFVRHAEKDTVSTDPGLTEAGKLRAKRIAHLLQDQDLAIVLSTPFNRTRETGQVIADSQGIELKEYNPFKTSVVKEWAKEYQGQAIIVVGHSNTVPTYINLLLEKEQFKQLPEGEYDNMFIVTTTKEGKAAVVVINTAPME